MLTCLVMMNDGMMVTFVPQSQNITNVTIKIERKAGWIEFATKCCDANH